MPQNTHSQCVLPSKYPQATCKQENSHTPYTLTMCIPPVKRSVPDSPEYPPINPICLIGLIHLIRLIPNHNKFHLTHPVRWLFLHVIFALFVWLSGLFLVTLHIETFNTLNFCLMNIEWWKNTLEFKLLG